MQFCDHCGLADNITERCSRAEDEVHELKLVVERYRRALAKIHEACERDWPEQLIEGISEAHAILDKK